MKLIIASAALLSAVTFNSCKTPLDPNREVILPEGPKMEKYYLSQQQIYRSLTSDSPVAQTVLTFQFSGSLMARKRHNVDQAKALAKATHTAPLNTKQFMLIIKGKHAGSNHSLALLHFLSASDVKLEQIQITTENEQSGGDLIETPKDVTLTKVEIREL